jgi:uncharacterized protein (DUF2267 family)
MDGEWRQMWCRGWLEAEGRAKEKEFCFQVSDMAKNPIGEKLRAETVEVAVGEALKRNIAGSYVKDWTNPSWMKDLGDELYLGSGHISHPAVGGTLHVTVSYD